jgi:L-seryl-tRNA(Ser) seleniumtransferase
MPDGRRSIPATGALLGLPAVAAACRRIGKDTVLTVIREVQQRCREGELEPDDVLGAVLSELPPTAAGLRAVVNATGVLVHTNLGRAPLSSTAIEALGVAAGATDVELDLATGERGTRGRAVLRALAAAVPRAEAAHVVNNGAAALALTVATLAHDREVVVARGELVEIGDGFRIPELIEAAGSQLCEVGTTNRVRIDDYERAITDRTGCVLKVHPSNFVVRGFTSSVDVTALARMRVPLVCDIGSGLLRPHPRLPTEPDADSALAGGADVVTCSGDKLLGGPQSGLVLGRRALVDRIRRHPLARAYRVDKLTLAALSATLTGPSTPVARSLGMDRDSLRARAHAVMAAMPAAAGADLVDTEGCVGGGGAPDVSLPSAAVAVDARLAEPLRWGEPAVVGRVHHGRLLLDLLAVDPDDDALLVKLVSSAFDAADGRRGEPER